MLITSRDLSKAIETALREHVINYDMSDVYQLLSEKRNPLQGHEFARLLSRLSYHLPGRVYGDLVIMYDKLFGGILAQDLLIKLPGGSFVIFVTNDGKIESLIEKRLKIPTAHTQQILPNEYSSMTLQQMGIDMGAFGYKAPYTDPYEQETVLFYFEDEIDACIAKVKYG